MTEAKKQPTKALILGGGGTTGIAWEMGLLLGLYDIRSTPAGETSLLKLVGNKDAC